MHFRTRYRLQGSYWTLCPIATKKIGAEHCIVASYPAKKFGVKTGMRVSEARRVCPGLVVVPARAPLYLEYHHKILKAVESVTPIFAVLSIDEMSVKLCPPEQVPEVATALAAALKAALRKQVGEAVTCSIGLAPNEFLAKLATDTQIPSTYCRHKENAVASGHRQP